MPWRRIEASASSLHEISSLCKTKTDWIAIIQIHLLLLLLHSHVQVLILTPFFIISLTNLLINPQTSCAVRIPINKHADLKERKNDRPFCFCLLRIYWFARKNRTKLVWSLDLCLGMARGSRSVGSSSSKWRYCNPSYYLKRPKRLALLFIVFVCVSFVFWDRQTLVREHQVYLTYGSSALSTSRFRSVILLFLLITFDDRLELVYSKQIYVGHCHSVCLTSYIDLSRCNLSFLILA